MEYDVLTEPSGSMYRNLSLMVHFLMVEALCEDWVFFPPSAESGHVVRTDGAYRQERIVFRVSEVFVHLFGHALDFKREYLQLPHYPGHTLRNHT